MAFRAGVDGRKYLRFVGFPVLNPRQYTNCATPAHVVNFAAEQAMKTKRGNRGIALLFL
jgi:hypothetical protein